MCLCMVYSMYIYNANVAYDDTRIHITRNSQTCMKPTNALQRSLLSTYLERDTKSVLIIRSTYYQGWFICMRYVHIGTE